MDNSLSEIENKEDDMGVAIDRFIKNREGEKSIDAIIQQRNQLLNIDSTSKVTTYREVIHIKCGPFLFHFKSPKHSLSFYSSKFPENFKNEVQIFSTVMSSDKKQNPISQQ